MPNSKEYIFHFSSEREENLNKDIIESQEVYDFEEDLVNTEDAFAIHKILHSIDEPYKEIFMLRTFGELPFARIGELFDKTEVWARVTYYRAKIKIQEELI